MATEDPAEPLAPLASAGDLGVYSGEEMGEGQADLLLLMASGVVRSYCGWRVAPQGVDTTSAWSSGQALMVPTLALASLQAVEVNGVAQVLDGWASDPSGLLWPPGGIYGWGGGQLAGGFGLAASRVRVTYLHGHQQVPGDVKAVALSVAARMLANPATETQESLGGYTVSHSTAGPAGLTPTERAILNRHRVYGRP